MSSDMSFDSLLLKAHDENPTLALLALSTLKGHRVISTGPVAEGLLIMVPDVLFFEKREVTDLGIFRQLHEEDVLFIENQSVDLLWKLSSVTRATIVHIADHPLDETICDLSIQEKDLRSAILSLGRFVESLKAVTVGTELSTPKNVAALLLDRDGVVIEDVGYAKSADQVVLKDGVIDLMQRARIKQRKIFIVTNQSGIARGTLTFSDYDIVNARMLQLLAEQGQYVDQVVKAIYFEKSVSAIGLCKKSLRKPRSGMILSLLEEHRVDLENAIMIGDAARDLMAAALAGVKELFLLETDSMSAELEKWKKWPLLSRALQKSNFQQIKHLDQVKI